MLFCAISEETLHEHFKIRTILYQHFLLLTSISASSTYLAKYLQFGRFFLQKTLSRQKVKSCK
jgi:hypothetical protein